MKIPTRWPSTLPSLIKPSFHSSAMASVSITFSSESTSPLRANCAMAPGLAGRNVGRVTALDAGRQRRVDVTRGLVVHGHAGALDPRGDDRLEGLLLGIRPDGQDVDLAAQARVVAVARRRPADRPR